MILYLRLARIDVGPDTYDLGCLTKDGTWKVI